MSNSKKYLVAGVGIAIVIAIGISFTSYLGQFEDPSQITSTTEGEMNIVHAPLMGSESAGITLVEFGDYQCEMCKHWFDNTRQQIVENYIDTGKINMIFLDVPFLGNDSAFASMASYCAQDQGRYWDYHVMLYQHQEGIDSGWASNERLKSFAFTLGLNMDEFSDCVDTNKYHHSVKSNFYKNSAMIESLSTPTFLIIDASGETKSIRGAQPYSVFEKVIESML